MKKILALLVLCGICASGVGCDKKPAANGPSTTTTAPEASTTTTK